jgi:hypothetical protein
MRHPQSGPTRIREAPLILVEVAWALPAYPLANMPLQPTSGTAETRRFEQLGAPLPAERQDVRPLEQLKANSDS